MRAAIYARKSTEQNGVADEARSVVRQVDGGRVFLESKGWTLDDSVVGVKAVKDHEGQLTNRPVLRHVYEDDGVSGALFANRAEFQRMMRDAAAGSFDAVVFFDIDRFGRNAQKTMTALNTLADLGIEVWDYSNGQRVDVESFEGELLTFMKARFAQQYRDSNRKHTTNAMREKAKAGYVTGCKVFGYDNVRLGKGQVKRRPNEAETAIVREIYERYARGEGYRQIAWALNARSVPAPRAQRNRPSGWEPSTVRSVLDRSTYRGEVIYGRTKKAYGRELGRNATREKGQVWTPENSWIRIHDESLRIIDKSLAAAVDARRGDRNSRYLRSMSGQLIGRPAPGAKYLLSGFMVCPCGARFEALKGGNWSYSGAVYVCAARRRKGPSVCSNSLALPIDMADHAVLAEVEGELLTDDFIEQVLESAFTRQSKAVRVAAEAQRDQHQRAIANITKAIAEGGDIPQLVASLKDLNRKLRATEAQLAPKSEPDRDALRLALEQRVEDWRQILRQHPKQARMVLQQLLEPIRVHTEGDRPSWVGQPRPMGLLAGFPNGMCFLRVR